MLYIRIILRHVKFTNSKTLQTQQRTKVCYILIYTLCIHLEIFTLQFADAFHPNAQVHSFLQSRCIPSYRAGAFLPTEQAGAFLLTAQVHSFLPRRCIPSYRAGAFLLNAQVHSFLPHGCIPSYLAGAFLLTAQVHSFLPRRCISS